MDHEIISISLLDGHKQNYRAHPPEQITQLKASLERFQQVRSIVVRPMSGGRYTILAGHGVVEAAKECGIPEIICDIVPNSWSDLDCKAYLVADNLLSSNASDDDEILVALLQEQADAGFDLAALGTDDETLRQMLEALGDEYAGGGSGEGDDDDFEAEPDEEQTRVRLGDVWQLGRHTIACLSATDPATYEKLAKGKGINLVWSDPPYGISIVKNNKVGAGNIAKCTTYAPIIGDETIDTAIKSFGLCSQYTPAAIQVWWGANYYAQEIPNSPCWIIWDKRSDSDDGNVMSSNNFADCELAWTNINAPSRVYRQLWNGMIRSGEHEKRVHPTQKPVSLAEWSYERFGKEQDVIFDPFLGSGMSLIAAENTNRTVIGCELSPDYIAVILTRWENHTSQTAELIERVEEVVNVL